MTDPSQKPQLRLELSAIAALAATDHAMHLRRFLYRRLGGPQDVEDLAQEVFLKLLRVNAQMRVEKPLAFIYSVAAKVLADHKVETAQDRAYLTSSDELPDELSERVSTALSDRLEENYSIHQQLEAALSKIPAKYAAVLLMIKRDGMSYEEVAAKLKVSTHTVHKYLREGRALLRRQRWQSEGTQS